MEMRKKFFPIDCPWFFTSTNGSKDFPIVHFLFTNWKVTLQLSTKTVFKHAKHYNFV